MLKAETHTVSVRNNVFQPNDLLIKPGDTVLWTDEPQVKEMAKQILRIIVVLSLCTSDASAQETDTGVPHNNGVIEEVVVTGVNQCGSWPIEHRDLIDCKYAELKKEDIQIMLNLRPKLFETCLTCQGNRCIGKVWRRDRIMKKLLCKRVFWTPTRVSRSKLYGGLTRPMKVSFTFKISTEGKVEDIELVSFEGDITEAKLVRLIKDGARKTRFEPLVIADMAYEIVGLRDEFASVDF